MTQRRHISALLVLMMLMLQLLMAQHYTVHFSEAAHTVAGPHTSGADGSKDPQADPDDLCQICLLSKTLSTAFGVVIVMSLAGRAARSAISLFPPSFTSNLFSHSFSARAPPV